MKKIVAVLGILALCSISGCVKAKHEYDDFVSYHNSLGGTITDFTRGYSSAAQGDPFGPTLEIIDEGQRLEEAKNKWRLCAWILSIVAFLASLAANGAEPARK